MEFLTYQEQLTSLISIFLIISILLELLLLPSTNNIKWFFLGLSVTLITVLIAYVFIIKPKKEGASGTRRFNGLYQSKYKPHIIRPSGRVKKVVMDGTCHSCNKPASMGFTCSYCNSYFCSDHRLPEKHDCTGLKESLS